MEASPYSIDGYLTHNDLRLIAEAIQRLRVLRGGDHLDIGVTTTILAAEVRRGHRDIFSLVRAGRGGARSTQTAENLDEQPGVTLRRAPSRAGEDSGSGACEKSGP